MLSYYYNLIDNINLSDEDKIRIATAILNTTKRSLSWFENYLNNSINSFKKKEDISIRWKKVNENLAYLKIKGYLFVIPKKIAIKIDRSQIEGLKINDIIRGSVTDHVVLKIDKDEIELDIAPEQDEYLFYNKIRLNYTIIQPTSLQGRIIDESNNQYIVYNERELNNAQKLKDDKIVSFIDFENIILKENNEKLKFIREEGLIIKLENMKYYGYEVLTNGIPFVIEKYSNNKYNYWIQLLENEENEEKEDIPGFSPIRYFFDDNVTVEDDKKNQYQIVEGIESENKIILKNKDNHYCYPPENSILKLKVNTYNLEMQLEAFKNLLYMPLRYHKKLIELFEKKEKVEWKTPEIIEIDEWYVLTDENRDGSNEQREFVKKALSTPDFAIMEGPPGSGKTTVIIELICQLVKKGKKILLCGSTHVAVDNVLERLKEKKDGGKSIIERLNILPVRIGDEKRISENIKEFQIENLKKNCNINEDLLLEISNLVCGTTIGILQNPKFKKRDKKVEPIYPEFDFLIIDEASKTRFQEFLVPALYAKRWIIIGDVKQLSPYTDREEIIYNLENIEKKIDSDYQKTLFLLFKIENVLERSNKSKFVLPVSSNIIKYTIKELQKGRLKDKVISIITSSNNYMNNSSNIIFFHTKDNLRFLELVASDLIIVDESLLQTIINKIPESFAILIYEDWKNSEHAFIHNNFQKKYKFQYNERDKEFSCSFEIVDYLNNYFKEKNWAEEIAWRLNREHELSIINNNKTSLKEKYRKDIEKLLPLNENINEKLDVISAIAFPSIIESLIEGIPVLKNKRNNNHQEFIEETTLSTGFDEKTLSSRRTVLRYQYRMHPDISCFPRLNFYNDNALKDSCNPSIEKLRKWTYSKYKYRSVWVNIEGKTVKNYNIDEVNILIKHLIEFIDYAKYNRQPENKVWSVACLTFYKGQERKLREELQKLTKNPFSLSNFHIFQGDNKINIKLHTVDKFQGQEADIVFLSMVQTKKDGFLDNPNRLNVSLTRAKFQLVIFGYFQYFAEKSNSEDLRKLALFHKEKIINESNT